MDIARGDIQINLDSTGAEAGLRRLEADYRAAMAKIDRMEAEAKIDVDTTEFDAKIKKEMDRLAIIKKEKANVRMGADTSELDRKMAIVQRRVDRLKGEKATIEIGTRGDRQTLATIETVRKAEAARAAAAERYMAARERHLVNDIKAAEKRSFLARKQELEDLKSVQRIARLRREYGKLDTELDKLERNVRKRSTSFGGIGREEKVKIDVDREHLLSQMEVVKKELEFLGGHPPVNIKVGIDSRTLRERFAGLLRGIGQRGDTRVNLGPITTSVRTLVLAGTALSSVVTSLVGSVGALAGVISTGLAGATSAAAGVIGGLVLNLGGVVATLVPVVKNFKLATQAQDAYTKAVAKYGANSKQAKTAQQQLNSVMASLDPSSRKAVEGLHKLNVEWQKLTGQDAQRNVGRVLKGGVDALGNLMPILARNTNEASDLLTNAITRWEKALGSRQGQTILGSLGRSANDFLRTALPGIDHLAAAFGHIAESAARLFAGRAGTGFAKWAADIDKATQPGQKLDDQVQRLGEHATDLLHLFGAAGRLIITVLNGGADAGDNMVQHMTRAINKWNEFLRSTRGRGDMRKFFSDSEKNTRALFNALTPLVSLFVQFSNALAPITTGMLQAFTWAAHLVGELHKVAGFTPAMKALGVALGGFLILNKVRSLVGSVRALFKGGEASAIIAAHAEGGKIAAAEIRAAMVAGGAAAGEEIAVAERAGGGIPGVGRAGRLSRLGRFAAPLLSAAPLALPVVAGVGLGVALHGREKNPINERGKMEARNAGESEGTARAKAYEEAYTKYLRSHVGVRGSTITPQVIAEARRAGEQAAGGITAAIKPVEGQVRAVNRSIAQLSHEGSGNLTDLMLSFRHNGALIEGTFGRNTENARKEGAKNFGALVDSIQHAMRDGRVSAERGLRAIMRSTQQYTRSSANITASNMDKVVSAIRGAMRNGQISAREGNRLIHKAFVDAFHALGLSSSDIKGLGPKTTPQDLLNLPSSNRPAPGPGHVPTNATGGYIGSPGEAGRDTELAMLGRGEAVLNRHQQGPVEFALANTYGIGLDDLFNQVNTPHYLARGGRIQKYARGGVTPAVSRAMNVLSRRFGLAVTSTTGGQHAAGSYHYSGHAADLAGAPAAMYRAAEYVKRSGMARSLAEGIHNPNLSIKNGKGVSPGFWGGTTWANHANHIHIAIAGALGALGGGGAPHIRMPTVRGRNSPLTALVRGGLSMETRGANAMLRRASASLGGGDSFDVGPTKGGMSFQAIRSLWIRAGGDRKIASLMAHIALAESSGVPSVINSIGATGLWQIYNHPDLVRRFGRMTNPLANARAAISLLSSQGLGAWAASRPVWGKYLARGGRISKYARGRRGAGGAHIAAKKAKPAPKGKKHHHTRIKPLKGFEKLTQRANYVVNERIPGLEELYSNQERIFDLTPEEFIVTPRATADNPNPKPYIDDRAVLRRKEELTTLLHMKRQIHAAERQAVTLLNRILALREARKRLKETYDRLIRERDKLDKEIRELRKQYTKVHGKGAAAEHRKISAQIQTKSNRRDDVNKSAQSIKQQLADWDTTMADAESNLQDLHGVSGQGGALADNEYDQKVIKGQLDEISPGSLAGQLADATGFDATTGADTSPDDAAIAAAAEARARLAEQNQSIAETTLAAFTGIGDISQEGPIVFGGSAASRILSGGAGVIVNNGNIFGGLTGGSVASQTLAGGGFGLDMSGGAAGGVGGAGVAGVGGGGVIVQQTFNSLLPTDPTILRQVGQAATGGLNYQGYTGGTTVVTGL